MANKYSYSITHAIIGDCPISKGIIRLCRNEFEAHTHKRKLRQDHPDSFIIVVPAPNGVVTHPFLKSISQ